MQLPHVSSEGEFERVLHQKLTKSVSAKIVDAAKKPFFKNWRGVIIGDGDLWFTQYRGDDHGPWTNGILAIGRFAFQTEQQEQLKEKPRRLPKSLACKLRYFSGKDEI